MGIHRFNDLIKKLFVNKTEHIATFRGKKVGVDAMNQLYRIVIGNNMRREQFDTTSDYIDTIAPEDNQNTEHIIAIITLIETIIERKIFPVFVFDGKKPEIKKKIVRESAASENPEISKYTHVNITRKQKEEVIKLIEMCGLPVIIAKGEADPQCAALTCNIMKKENIVDYIITEDSDILIFGAKSVMKNFSRKSATINIIEQSDILNEMLKVINNILLMNNKDIIGRFTENNLIDLSILFGTDYNKSISYVKSIDDIIEIFALNDMNINKVAEYILQNKIPDYEIPEDYAKEWAKVREYYTHVEVLEPREIDMAPKMASISEIKRYLSECNFREDVIIRLLTGLKTLRNLYDNIYKNNTAFTSFASYQVKYHNKSSNYMSWRN